MVYMIFVQFFPLVQQLYVAREQLIALGTGVPQVPLLCSCEAKPIKAEITAEMPQHSILTRVLLTSSFELTNETSTNLYPFLLTDGRPAQAGCKNSVECRG